MTEKPRWLGVVLGVTVLSSACTSGSATTSNGSTVVDGPGPGGCLEVLGFDCHSFEGLQRGLIAGGYGNISFALDHENELCVLAAVVCEDASAVWWIPSVTSESESEADGVRAVFPELEIPTEEAEALAEVFNAVLCPSGLT